MTKKRNSSIELIRILSMFLIVIGHFGFITNWSVSHSSNLVLMSSIHSLWIGGKLGVDLFVLISGYFLIFSKFKKTSFFNVWYTSYFYAILILIFAIVMRIDPINIKNIVKTIFLSTSGYLNWFVTAYLVMYLLSPFINKLLLSLSKVQFKLLLMILVIYFSVFRTVFHNPSLGTTGNDAVWLIVVYCCGAYIRRFKSDLLKYTTKCICIILIVSLFLSVSSVFLIDQIQYYLSLFSNHNSYGMFVDGFSPLQLVSAVCIFLLFMRMKPFHSNIVNTISSTTFAVYLIHANTLIGGWIYNDVVKGYQFENTPFVLLYGILTSVMIFVVCSVIDLFFKFIFGKANRKIVNIIAGLRIWYFLDDES